MIAKMSPRPFAARGSGALVLVGPRRGPGRRRARRARGDPDAPRRRGARARRARGAVRRDWDAIADGTV